MKMTLERNLNRFQGFLGALVLIVTATLSPSLIAQDSTDEYSTLEVSCVYPNVRRDGTPMALDDIDSVSFTLMATTRVTKYAAPPEPCMVVFDSVPAGNFDVVHQTLAKDGSVSDIGRVNGPVVSTNYPATASVTISSARQQCTEGTRLRAIQKSITLDCEVVE